MAEALYTGNPGKATPARIYALSLYQQQRTDEAEKVLAALPTEALHEPVAALYYGLCLATTGQFDKSREYLKIAEGANLLTEEKTLLANAQEALQVDAKHAVTNATTQGF